MQKECLALIRSLIHWEAWTYKSKVVCLTDNKPITYLQTMASHDAKLLRWLAILQAWDVEIKHTPANQNQRADALTRLEAKD